MVKARERSTPLWLLMLATVWLDIVFVPLFLRGIETLQPVHGKTGYGSAIIYADYTHSLVGMLVLSAILGGICWPLWGRRVALVVCAVSASHWVLDLLVHRADMPILPGNLFDLPRLGLGLWRMPVGAASAELVLVLAGAWTYWRAARTVSIQNHRGARFAATVSTMIAVCGILILFLDFTS